MILTISKILSKDRTMKTIIFLFTILFILLLTFDSFGQWGSDVRLTNNSGASLPVLNNSSKIATNGSTVHVVWFDESDGNREIYYKRSTDNGLNWGADIRLTNNNAESSYPSIAVSGSFVYVVWQDYRHGNGDPRIFYKRSTDGGVS